MFRFPGDERDLWRICFILTRSINLNFFSCLKSLVFDCLNVTSCSFVLILKTLVGTIRFCWKRSDSNQHIFAEENQTPPHRVGFLLFSFVLGGWFNFLLLFYFVVIFLSLTSKRDATLFLNKPFSVREDSGFTFQDLWPCVCVRVLQRGWMEMKCTLQLFILSILFYFLFQKFFYSIFFFSFPFFPATFFFLLFLKNVFSLLMFLICIFPNIFPF